VFFAVALAIGALVGIIACIPAPSSDTRTALRSIALGLVGSFVGWEASSWLGMAEVGPIARLFVAFVAAGALVSVYHAAISERAGLR
jgi:uncharacterized membrane protein YeaQ/YmgE (transglycosylase-associated protein family)